MHGAAASNGPMPSARGLVVGMIGGCETKHVKNLRGNGDLALSGRNLNGRHNDQPKVDVRGRRDIGEAARGG